MAHKQNDEEERDVHFFLDLLDCATELGIQEVAMAVNSVTDKGNDRNLEFLSVLGKRAKQNKLRFSVTTNHENIRNYGGEIFSHCDLVSLSYNDFLFRTRPENFFSSLSQLKTTGVKTNLNVLLSTRIMESLAHGLLEEMLRHTDSVYLIVPKLIPLDFTVQQFLNFLTNIEPFFTNFDTFMRVQLDNCMKPTVFPFSELVPYSECGTSLIAVNPYGEVSFCAFEEPSLKLGFPSEIKKVIAGYNGNLVHRKRKRCPFISFRQE